MNLSRRIKILFAILLILFISIPITLTLVQNRQDPRSEAAKATTISLVPQPGSSNSIQKTAGEDIPINVVVNPGINAVHLIRLHVQYDPNFITLPNPAAPFTLNEDLENEHIEFEIKSKTTTSNTVTVVIATDIDSLPLQSTPQTVGTFHFKAVKNTDGQETEVKLTNQTEAYSSETGDEIRENIISTTIPAKIMIGDGIPQGSGTPLSFVIRLHGIGVAGDTKNPTNNNFSNKDPQTPERILQAFVYNTDNQEVAVSTGSGKITYQTNNEDGNLNGKFVGTVYLTDWLEDGSYIIKVKTDRYLRKKLLGTIQINGQQNNPIKQEVELVAGDINGDNELNIFDYNALRDCGYGALTDYHITNINAPYNSDPCKGHNRENADLDDNKYVNAFDYNLFLREFSVGSGD